MDNLTHTFVGLALAESGLKRRTALGTATLAIGANFPDIDVIAVPLGRGFEWRRGATHGFLALAVLPFVLAGIMWLADQHIRRRRNPTATPADFRQLVILSAIAIATHPTLDFMNTYGMRWLMPFVNKWFYADGLFILDIWLLGTLIIGFLWSRYAESPRPARVALAAFAVYTTAMLIVTGLGRARVAAEYPGRRVMVQPTDIFPQFPWQRPWERGVLVEEDDRYRFGGYSPFRGVGMGTSTLLKGQDDPAVALAQQAPEARGFLRWARFPFYVVLREGDTTIVRIADARYSGAAATGWASVEVRLFLPDAKKSSSSEDHSPIRRSIARAHSQVRGKEALPARRARPGQDGPQENQRVPSPARGEAEGSLQLRGERGPAAALHGARAQDAGAHRR